jgi:hypothetical protein
MAMGMSRMGNVDGARIWNEWKHGRCFELEVIPFNDFPLLY